MVLQSVQASGGEPKALGNRVGEAGSSVDVPTICGTPNGKVRLWELKSWQASEHVAQDEWVVGVGGTAPSVDTQANWRSAERQWLSLSAGVGSGVRRKAEG